MRIHDCEICAQAQEVLFNETGGSCGQIMCTHDMENDDDQPPTVDAIRFLEENSEVLDDSMGIPGANEMTGEEIETKKIAVAASTTKMKRKKNDTPCTYPSKKLKKLELEALVSEDETNFPSVNEMEETRNMSLEKLALNKVYQIMDVELKDETYNGVVKTNAYLILREKGKIGTITARATSIIKSKLCEEEQFAERTHTHRFYFLNKGWKTSEQKKEYRDFIIKACCKT